MLVFLLKKNSHHFQQALNSYSVENTPFGTELKPAEDGEAVAVGGAKTTGFRCVHIST